MDMTKIKDDLKDEGRKVITRWAFHGLAIGLVFFVWEPLRDFASAIVRTPAVLNDLIERVDQLDQKLSAVAGETRVIAEVPSMHYVGEPVYRGEDIVLYLAVQRTQWGAGCQLQYRTALFTDSTNIVTTGERAVPSRQIGASRELVRLALRQPEGLALGRNTVSLTLIFDCHGKTVIEYTTPVAFLLRERPANGGK